MMDTRSYAALEHGDSLCCTLTFILYLVLFCKDVDELVMDLREIVMRHIQFTLCPSDISGWLHDALLADKGVTILTSATMTNQSNGSEQEMYSYIAGNIGFSHYQGDFATPKPSPFDYDHHAMMYCADDLPHPTKDKEEFIQMACDRIIELIEVSHGSALILFTAKADLDAVYEELSKRGLPYTIMRPYVGASQADTLDSFRMQKNTVSSRSIFRKRPYLLSKKCRRIR